MKGNSPDATVPPEIQRTGGASRLSGLIGATTAGTGVLAGLVAFFAASCCALPLIFVILGMGGAWLSIFDVFLGVRIEAVTISAVIVALGWSVFLVRRIAHQRQEAGPSPGSPPVPIWRSKIFRLLTLASAFVVSAWLINEYQGDITRSLFELRSWINE